MNDAVEKIVNKIKETTNPVEIILFGSQAYGKPSTDSDIDIAVVVKSSDKSFHDRIIELRKNVRSITPIDFFVFTQDEAENLIKTNSFVEEIFARGKTVYAQ